MKIFIRVFLFLTLFIVLFIPFSCGKKCTCSPGGLDIEFVGFTLTEVDTVVVRKFHKGTNFLSQIDSAILNTNNSGYTQSNDTIFFQELYRSPYFESINDYELFFPEPNLTYRLTDIREIIVEENCIQRNLHGCRNQITSVKINGIDNFITRREPYFDSDILYLHK